MIFSNHEGIQFDSNKAFNYLLKQCEFGPRYPGSDGHELFKDYLKEFLSDKGDELKIYEHIVRHPYKDETEITLYNFLLRYNIKEKNRFLIMAHWDTREIADRDPNPKNRGKPILGANDGASGISILMTLSELLNQHKFKNIGIDLLFVDGEDMGRQGELENYCIGTTSFCEVLPEPNPQYAICLDMVGDKNPHFPVETFSYIQAPWLVEDIWALANDLGYYEFKYDLIPGIYDDHRALYLNSGIPAIDIIDFDYDYWHTISDIPENCSKESLGIVGDVILNYILNKDNE